MIEKIINFMAVNLWGTMFAILGFLALMIFIEMWRDREEYL